MFVCYEDGKECVWTNFKSMRKMNGMGWDNARFDTAEEAKEYLSNWCGWLGVRPADIQIGVPLEYYGTMYIIKEIA